MQFGWKTVGIGLAVGVLGGGSAFLACSSDHPESAAVGLVDGGPGPAVPATDASTMDASTGDAGPLSCTVPSLNGGVVTAHFVDGSVPADTGGPIVSGTYDLTAVEVYSDEATEGQPSAADAGPGLTAQATFVIADGHHGSVEEDESAGRSRRTRRDVEREGEGRGPVHLHRRNLPDDRLAPDPYSAVGDVVTLHTGQHQREVYTRRP